MEDIRALAVTDTNVARGVISADNRRKGGDEACTVVPVGWRER